MIAPWRPRILVVADTPGWAWGRKALEYERWLSGVFEVTVIYQIAGLPDDLSPFDLIHLFEVSQLRSIPETYSGPLVAGLTAMVWWTWGEDRMRAWADRCSALHGNSRMLVHELQQFHSRVYYTPNGVDPMFWHRDQPRGMIIGPDRGFSVCHVGKPNPRKGAALLIEACRRAEIPLYLCQRTSHIRLPWEDVREFYRRSWVHVSISDMDGTPNTALEAAACECAIISTPIGNMAEFIEDGVNGFLIGRELLPRPFRPWIAALVEPQPEKLPGFARWSPAEILDRRERLIADLGERLVWMRDHPAEAARMGAEARRTIRREWAWRRQVDHVARMWGEVLA